MLCAVHCSIVRKCKAARGLAWPPVALTMRVIILYAHRAYDEWRVTGAWSRIQSRNRGFEKGLSLLSPVLIQPEASCRLPFVHHGLRCYICVEGWGRNLLGQKCIYVKEIPATDVSLVFLLLNDSILQPMFAQCSVALDGNYFNIDS